MVAQTLGFILLVAVVIFGAAGRLDIPMFWLYLGVIAAASAAGLFLIDEDLARERMRPGGQPPGLRLYVIFLLCVAHWTIAGLDRRFHWSDTVPLSLRIAALVVFAAGLAFFIWAMHVNRFFSSVVRIQRERGHHVVTGGPYRWVRHPGYAGAIPATMASGLAPAPGSQRQSARSACRCSFGERLSRTELCVPSCRATEIMRNVSVGGCCPEYGDVSCA
jgi:hypothetical protein